VFVQLQGRPATAVELWINGAQIEVQAGKRVDSPYLFSTPAALHDGFLELELRVYDDLGTLGTQTLTVLKGAACTSAATCPGGYTFSEGRCLAPAGALAVGASCSRSDQCASKECIAHGGALVCTEPCWQATAACPSGMTCDRADDERFGCFVPLDDGGCCSAGGDARGALGLAALVGLLVLRRRRRAA
jgi:MYXO-CTERM domain-containing protein